MRVHSTFRIASTAITLALALPAAMAVEPSSAQPANGQHARAYSEGAKYGLVIDRDTFVRIASISPEIATALASYQLQRTGNPVFVSALRDNTVGLGKRPTAQSALLMYDDINSMHADRLMQPLPTGETLEVRLSLQPIAQGKMQLVAETIHASNAADAPAEVRLVMGLAERKHPLGPDVLLASEYNFAIVY